MKRLLLALAILLVFAATANAAWIWDAQNQTGNVMVKQGFWALESYRSLIANGTLEDGTWDTITVQVYSTGTGGRISGVAICERSGLYNCVAGSHINFTDPGAGAVLNLTATNGALTIDGTKDYLFQFYYINTAEQIASFETAAAGNWRVAGDQTATNDWSGLAPTGSNYAGLLAANMTGVNSTGTAITFTPTSSQLNTAATFTAAVTSNSSSATAWYWFFNNSGDSLFYDTSAGLTTTQTLNRSGWWNVTLIGTFDGTNYTNSTGVVAVVSPPTANFTITTATPWMYGTTITFNETGNYSTGNASIGGAWGASWWDFDDGNTSTTQNGTNIFVEPGYYNVCLMVANNYSLNASAEYCSNTTINGLAIDVFNEKTWAAVTNFTLTISNSTTTQTYTDRNNTFTWSNFTGIPTGAVTISISATGYVGRTYYRSYNLNTPLNLDAYLLATADGVYSYFIAQDTLGNNLADVLLIFTFTNGSATVTAGEVKTDDTGSATMWLDWTKTYLLTASKEGFSPVTKSLTPQPTTYVIIMGSASVFNYTSVNDSLWVFFTPNNPVVNITADTISGGVFDPDSSISICGINLTFMNGTLFNSTNTTTEQSYCVNSISLAGSGALAGEKFYGVLWWELNGTDGEGQRLFNPISTGYTLQNSTAELYDYLGGPDARLIFAALLTLMAGAGAAFYLGSGSVLIMMAVSGIFVYWGWFDVGIVVAGVPGAVLLWFVAVMAGLSVLYLERGGA